MASTSSCSRPAGDRYAVRFRVNGKPKKLTLPKGTKLADARIAAAEALKKAGEGSDPTITKKKQKEAAQIAAAGVLKAIAEQYLDREGKKKEGERRHSSGQAAHVVAAPRLPDAWRPADHHHQA